MLRRAGRPPRCSTSPTPPSRYYVLQFVDAWTNNFAYVGRRATGTDGGPVPPDRRPDHDGEVPGRAPRSSRPRPGSFGIVGRVAGRRAPTTSPRCTRSRTSSALTPPRRRPSPGRACRWPTRRRAPRTCAGGRPFARALAAFPPPAGDAEFLAICERLGLHRRAHRPTPTRSRSCGRCWSRRSAQGRETDRRAAWPAVGPGRTAGRTAAAPLRLQPRPLRGRHHRRARSGRSPTARSPTPPGPSPPGPGCGATTATRPTTTSSASTPTASSSTAAHTLRAAPGDPAAGRRVLVADHVRRAGLLPGRQPDRPLLDRRPHARPASPPTTARSRS